MAESVQDDLELKPAKAGAAFRAEMFVTDLALRYWKHAAAAVVTILVVVLVYGQVQQYRVAGQRTTAREVSAELAKLPAPLPQLSASVAEGKPIDTARLAPVGEALVAIANGASGPAAVDARMTAAEVFRLVGDKARQREALTKALPDATGVLAWSVDSALANLDLEEGKGDDAVGRLKKLSVGEGFLAEQSTLDLGLALESLDRDDEAAKVYADFLTRFPTSTRADDARARQARLTP